MTDVVKPVIWTAESLQLLDQRLLPHREEYVECRTAAEVAAAIREMVVRGAPAIGVAAAYAMVLACHPEPPQSASADKERRRISAAQALVEAASLLKASRPTAVNLAWAVDRMMRLAERDSSFAALEREAVAIHEEDIAANRAIGRYGQQLLGVRSTVLTHCNAGALATGGYGTALGVIRAAVEAGKSIAVFADETRPWLQGARLTAWELQREGIDVTLIADNMAGHFFQKKTFDAVIVGADRIARNGDVANKIGTYTVAVLARAHGVPFYVAAPTSTVDMQCVSGDDIPIEERGTTEVLETKGLAEDGAIHVVRVAPEGTQARHPAFDVTPADLVSAIITERGIARPPFNISLQQLTET